MVITNNPLVLARYSGSIQVEGGPVEVFKMALSLLDQGAVLSGHPLAGSIRLAVNPYRSLVIEPCARDILDRKGIAALLDAIDRVEKGARERSVPPDLIEDYAAIELELLEDLVFH